MLEAYICAWKQTKMQSREKEKKENLVYKVKQGENDTTLELSEICDWLQEPDCNDTRATSLA